MTRPERTADAITPDITARAWRTVAPDSPAREQDVLDLLDVERRVRANRRR
jgi:hypothetical protein